MSVRARFSRCSTTISCGALIFKSQTVARKTSSHAHTSAPACFSLPFPNRTGSNSQRPAAVPHGIAIPDRRDEVRIRARLQSGRINSGAQRLPWFGRVRVPVPGTRIRPNRCLPPKLSRILQNFQMWKTCQEARSKSKVITSHSTPLTPLYPQSILAVLFLQYDILNL
jgi:hypothetical protein